MKVKRIVSLAVSMILIVSMLSGCGGASSSSGNEKPAAGGDNTASGSPDKAPRMVLIVNRNFGDKGPIDSQARGLEKVPALGFETKSLESLSPDVFEEDIRAMAKEGYNVIVTSFPQVSEAAVAVAKDYPDTAFVGIYEFVNAGDNKISNFWSVEYKLQELMYVVGAYHAKMTQSKKIGIITGEETVSSYSEVNGFLDGVAGTDPDCEVEVAFANTYADPAKGKEIALAMISRGVDTICLLAGSTSMGAIDACEENGIHCTADNGDFYDRGPNSVSTSANANFGLIVELAAKDYLADAFKGGEHSIMSLFEDGVYVAWDEAERFSADHPEQSDKVNAAIEYAKGVEEEIKSGKRTVEYRDERP